MNANTFVLQTVTSLWENLPTILLGGLLLSLFCAPTLLLIVFGWVGPALVTVALLVAPAWSALMRMQGTLAAGKATSVVEMWQSFPTYWRASFRLGVIGVAPLYLLFRLLPILPEPTNGAMVWVVFVIIVFVAAFVCALSLYAFPLTVLYNLPVATVLRNSAILASRYAGNTVGLMSMGLLFGLAVGYFSLALLFILPAIYAWFIVNHCLMAVGEQEKLERD